MKKIKIISGYLWAILCLIIVLIMFPGLNYFSEQFARLPFMKINPVYSGGEVVQQIDKENYTLQIHKPVFDALIGESSKGFVQITWKLKYKLPELLNDTIDYDADGNIDLIIVINTDDGKTQITALNKNVKTLHASAQTESGWIVRVKLVK